MPVESHLAQTVQSVSGYLSLQTPEGSQILLDKAVPCPYARIDIIPLHGKPKHPRGHCGVFAIAFSGSTTGSNAGKRKHRTMKNENLNDTNYEGKADKL